MGAAGFLLRAERMIVARSGAAGARELRARQGVLARYPPGWVSEGGKSKGNRRGGEYGGILIGVTRLGCVPAKLRRGPAAARKSPSDLSLFRGLKATAFSVVCCAGPLRHSLSPRGEHGSAFLNPARMMPPRSSVFVF
jgi:hypothetical protein